MPLDNELVDVAAVTTATKQQPVALPLQAEDHYGNGTEAEKRAYFINIKQTYTVYSPVIGPICISHRKTAVL